MTRLSVTSTPAGPLLAAVLMALGCTRVAGAQDADAPRPPAHVSYVDGRVLLESEGTSDAADEATPVVPGDRLRTESGRAELLFGDGSLVQLDADTTIDLLSEARIRLLGGRIAIVASSAQADRLQVDTPQGSIAVRGAGEYRVWLFEDEGRQTVELSVVRGSADVATDVDRVTVNAGERSWARLGEAPAYPVRFNAAAFDAFDQWALDRAAARRGSVSVQYVPPTLRTYAGVLDTYGSWGYEPTYGYVWYPRVAVGWRPYYAGRWHFYGGFGWTWVGGGAWGWPTHHYGRWGLSTAGAWYWIPGAVWGPAWVSWGVAPGYVSWCALGYNNRPVIGWGGYGYGGGHHGGYGHQPWHAWTVVPRDRFGGYRAVSASAIDGRAFAQARGGPALVQQDRAPAPPSSIRRGGHGLGVAVPRNASAAPVAAQQGGGTRRATAGAGVPAAPGVAPPSLARTGDPLGGTAPATPSYVGRGSVVRQAGVERTPEDLARASRLPAAPPRAGRYADRLPGDAGRRTLPAGDVPGAVSTLPGSRGHGLAAPRAGTPTTGWSADQVQVHRGMPIEPDAATVAPPAARTDGAGAWSGGRMPPPARAGSPGAYERPGADRPAIRSWGTPGMAMPRGVGVPDGPRALAPAGQPSYRMAPPSPPPPPPAAAPAASAAPRQAPPSGAAGGTAAPRGGGASGHHR